MKIFQTFWGGQYWNDPTLRSKSFQCQVQSTDKIPENARFWPFELWSLHGSFLPEQSPTKNSDSIVQQLKTSTVLGGGREGEGWNHHCWWSAWIQERGGRCWRDEGVVLKRCGDVLAVGVGERGTTWWKLVQCSLDRSNAPPNNCRLDELNMFQSWSPLGLGPSHHLSTSSRWYRWNLWKLPKHWITNNSWRRVGFKEGRTDSYLLQLTPFTTYHPRELYVFFHTWQFCPGSTDVPWTG